MGLGSVPGGLVHAHACNRRRAARRDRGGAGRRDQHVHLDRDQGGDGRIAAALRARERPRHSRELCPVRRADPPFRPRRTRRRLPYRQRGDRRAHQARQDRRRPHRPRAHRDRHRRAQGRAQARRVVGRSAQARAIAGEDRGPRRALRRQHHGGAYPGGVPAARHRRRGDAEDQARGRRPQRPRQRAGLERRSRDRAAASVRADVESRGRGDRHAAGGSPADYDLFRRRDDERRGSRSSEGADQGADGAVRGTRLQGKGTRSGMVGGIVMSTFAIAAAAALIVITGSVQAAEIDAMITTAMKAAIEELAPPFERAGGHTLRVSYGPSGGLARRLNGGEAADLIVVESKVLDELIKQGKVAPGRTDLARTAIGIAVRKGAPRPNVSSAEALRRALLAAKSIGHTAPAGGGVTAAHIEAVLEKLGIATEVAPKIKLAAGGPNGRVSVLVSSGEAEIGLQLVSELMSNPEVEVIGMLPPELQLNAVISAGITPSTKQSEPAQAFIRHLASPGAMTIYKAKGLGL